MIDIRAASYFFQGGKTTMKRTKLSVIGFGVLVLLFVRPVSSSAQNLLDGVWFKVKASMKGYEVSSPDDTIVGKVVENNTMYLYTQHDIATGDYTVTTCSQDFADPNQWYANANRIDSLMIKGSGNPEQMWNFHDAGLLFFNKNYWHYTYPMLLLKISSNDTASLSTLGCAGRFVNSSFTAWGSCSLKGKSVSRDKVPGTALMSCEPFRTY
jgi:hypothetical protein